MDCGKGKVRFQAMIKLTVLTALEGQMPKKHVVGNTQLLAGSNNAKKNTVRSSRTMPCQFFNQGTCSHSATHETKGVLYKHVCSFCFTSGNKMFPHTESECRNKKKNVSKNEEVRA